MKTLTIDRSKWRTGGLREHQTGKGETLLLNKFGYMCCLGFYCLQAGVDKNTIKHQFNPANLQIELKDDDKNMRVLLSDYKDSFGEWNLENTEFADDAITINDNPDIDSKTREEQITEHFAKVGVEIVFVGEYSELKFT